MYSKLAAFALFATAAAAQIPDGHVVVSSFYYSGNPGGLWVLDPRITEAPRPIVNLPRELVALPTVYSHGSNCVKILPDGRLAVGEMEIRDGQPADLYLLTLSGLQVVDYERIPIGTVTTGTATVDEIVLLPGGDLIVSAKVDNGVLFRVSLETRTATPIPVTGLPPALPVVGAIGLDPTGTQLYLSDIVEPYHVRKMDVNGGEAKIIGTAGQHGLMATDHDGLIYMPIVAWDSTIDRMDPATGVVTTLGLSGGSVNGIQIEPATGLIIFKTNGYGGGPARQVRIMDPATGQYTELVGVPGGIASGVAIAPNPTTYGDGTPGSAHYRWQTATNPGGLPRIGNAQFGARVLASNGDATGALLTAAEPGSLPVLGMTLLLDVRSLAFLSGIPASGDLSLPIPNEASIVGQKLFLQSVHLDSGAPRGLAATPGLRISLLR